MSENYYFAKLNVNQNLFNSNIKFEDIKDKYIPKQIRSFNEDRNNKRFYDKKTNAEWTITDVDDIDENIIYGRLSKITTPKDSFKIVSGNKTRKDSSDIAYVSDFYYFIRQEYILFNTNMHIKYETFVSIFGDVLYNCGSEDGKEKMGELEIRLLTRVSEFKKELFDNRVFKISLDYVAPNDPSSINDFYEIFDDSESGKLELNNKTNGIRIRGSKVMSHMFHVVERGWGSLKAKVGENYKNSKTISTKAYPLKTRNYSELSKSDKIACMKEEVDEIEKERSKAQ